MREQDAQTDLLLRHRVPPVVNDQVEAGPGRAHELPEGLPAPLVTLVELDAVGNRAGQDVLIETVDNGVRKVVPPHSQGRPLEDADFQYLPDVLADWGEVRVIEGAKPVRDLVGLVCHGEAA